MNAEERLREHEDFLALLYQELEKTLDIRPKNPVTAFAKR